ncbi:uncharacterized protein LOC119997378 isoform X2 [Tripterygium wilfordii]|uniref:uncharacterized protein LOC119997378 isoform X2 n=1 Tax=Tripterygium wilfordii TaxID=458696 RepID=UPI0018F82F49|nr:uncharacterized protein LOC119997378 isoform X2 [Tripterygium wilfordii]
MMVLNSFDLWQKDAFFSAAEEVQESADVMQSTYRMWLRERREGITPEHFDELSRELQTALGTAKWQLEEFERAVRLSQGRSYDDIKTSRHRQFVAAIEGQISHVEEELMEAFSENGKQPLQWVNLDENERDDLAMFLSGTSEISETSTRGSLMENHHRRKDFDLNTHFSKNISDEMETSKVSTTRKDPECIIDIEEKETLGTRDDIICPSDKATGSKRTWSKPNFGALKIVIADKGESSRLLSSVEATPKEKGSKSIFWQRFKDHAQAKGAVNVCSQISCRIGGLQRQIPNSLPLQLSRSIQLMLALMLSIFLIMHFVLYTN